MPLSAENVSNYRNIYLRTMGFYETSNTMFFKSLFHGCSFLSATRGD